MSENQSTSPRKLFNVAVFIASSVLLVPVSSFAESMTFVQTADAQKSSRVASLKKVCIGLDEDGNALLRYGKVSVTFIYDAGSSSSESRTQSWNSTTPRQEVASLGGLSVKLGFAF